MYESYFGLTRKPFDLSPDPTIIFSNEMYQEALSVLQYGIADRKGFLLLTGGVGTGKTTLLQILVNSIGNNTRVCLIANPKISINDFYYHVAHTFGLEAFDGNKSKFLINFTEFIKGCGTRNERVILIIDEAQVLPIDVIEEIRLLSNQEYLEYGIMSIFLVGQPELNERLTDKRLLPLRQRIGIRFHLKPLSLQNTGQYINYRLQKSGCKQTDLFAPNAIQLIHAHTKGVPRLINNICDQSLLHAFAESHRRIDEDIVKQAVKGLYIPGEQETKVSEDKEVKIRPQLDTKQSQGKRMSVYGICLLLIIAGLSYFFWDVSIKF